MGKISERAKFIDLYASRPELSFGKDGKVYSRLGLLLTFLTIIITGGMAIWVGIRIFGRNTPSFLQYELPPQSYDPTIPLSADDFKFGIRVVDPIGNNIEDALLAYAYIFYGLGTNYFLNMNTECKFDLAPDDKYKCFYQDEDTKGKTYLDSKEEWEFYVQYKPCQWLHPDGVGCGNEESGKEYRKNEGVVASIMYEDLVIDPFNYENPTCND